MLCCFRGPAPEASRAAAPSSTAADAAKKAPPERALSPQPSPASSSAPKQRSRVLLQTAVESLLGSEGCGWQGKLNSLAQQTHAQLLSLFVYSDDSTAAVVVYSTGPAAYRVPQGLVEPVDVGTSHSMLLETAKPITYCSAAPSEPLPQDWQSLAYYEDAQSFLLLPLRRGKYLFGSALLCLIEPGQVAHESSAYTKRALAAPRYDGSVLEELAQYLAVSLLGSAVDAAVLQLVADAAAAMQRASTVQEALACLVDVAQACLRLTTRLELECLPAVAFGPSVAAFFRTQHHAHDHPTAGPLAVGGAGAGGNAGGNPGSRAQSRTMRLEGGANTGDHLASGSLISVPSMSRGQLRDGSFASIALEGAGEGSSHAMRRPGGHAAAGGAAARVRGAGSGLVRGGSSNTLSQSPLSGALPGSRVRATAAPLQQTLLSNQLDLAAAMVAAIASGAGGGGAGVTGGTTGAAGSSSVAAPHSRLLLTPTGSGVRRGGGGAVLHSPAVTQRSQPDIGTGITGSIGELPAGPSRLSVCVGSAAATTAAAASSEARAGSGAGGGGGGGDGGGAAPAVNTLSAVVPNCAAFLMADERQAYKDVLLVQRLLPQARVHSLVLVLPPQAASGVPLWSPAVAHRCSQPNHHGPQHGHPHHGSIQLSGPHAALLQSPTPASQQAASRANTGGGGTGSGPHGLSGEGSQHHHPHQHAQSQGQHHNHGHHAHQHQHQHHANGHSHLGHLASGPGNTPRNASHGQLVSPDDCDLLGCSSSTATASAQDRPRSAGQRHCLHAGAGAAGAASAAHAPATSAAAALAAALGGGDMSSPRSHQPRALLDVLAMHGGGGSGGGGLGASGGSATLPAFCPPATLAMYLAAAESVPRAILEQVAEDTRQLLQVLHRPLSVALCGPLLAAEWVRFVALVLARAPGAAAAAAAVAAASGGGSSVLSVSATAALAAAAAATHGGGVMAADRASGSIVKSAVHTQFSADYADDMSGVSVVFESPAANTGALSLMISSMRDVLSTVQLERVPDFRPLAMDDVHAVRLLKVIGRGGQGCVFQGLLYNTVVAVKVIPSADEAEAAAAAAAATDGASASASVQASGGGGGGSGLRPDTFDAQHLVQAAEAVRKVHQRHKRRLLRDALEVAVTSTLSHPNIVQVLSFFTETLVVEYSNEHGRYRLMPREENPTAKGSSNTVIVMEYCDAGTLKQALDGGCFKARALPPPAAANPATAAAHAASNAGGIHMLALLTSLLEVAAGLRHLHEQRLVHCDVKPSNILLRSSATDPRGWTCKLSDFGCVRLLTDTDPQTGRPVFHALSPVGSLSYMSPESMYRDATLDASIDVYAFGITMWECAMGQLPYTGVASQQLPNLVRRGLRPSFHPRVPQEYRQIAVACWSQDVRRRPSAAALMQMLQRMLSALVDRPYDMPATPTLAQQPTPPPVVAPLAPPAQPLRAQPHAARPVDYAIEQQQQQQQQPQLNHQPGHQPFHVAPAQQPQAGAPASGAAPTGARSAAADAQPERPRADAQPPAAAAARAWRDVEDNGSGGGAGDAPVSAFVGPPPPSGATGVSPSASSSAMAPIITLGSAHALGSTSAALACSSATSGASGAAAAPPAASSRDAAAAPPLPQQQQQQQQQSPPLAAAGTSAQWRVPQIAPRPASCDGVTVICAASDPRAGLAGSDLHAIPPRVRVDPSSGGGPGLPGSAAGAGLARRL